ncbi:YceD family protein [Acetobacter fallax]|uniref:DUF177 domain-containing protein n=1 Tax=Acetobacter fallax TaxID=1737473 RepID=A0ABX0KJW2_9PROT|nr:DUF177 domain-containing protein [Acetobacter fallax]NHO37724.1 DUF177 domain-containing protein [Acetobacter fallax]
MTDARTPEFSRPILLRSLRDARAESPREVAIEASAAECGRIAKRLGLPSIASLSCRYRLSSQPRDSVLAEAALTARLSQSCVLTLDVFEDVIAERFVIRFVPESEFREDQSGDFDVMDEIPYEGDSIDLGEAVVEQLALVLDPYPRRPGAERPADVMVDEDLPADEDVVPDRESVRRPFAGLAQMKREKK